MGNKLVLLGTTALVALAIYLFATAPPPLMDEVSDEARVPVEVLFRVLAAENDAARGLYTRRVVGPGLAAGLRFDERWKQEEVEAGPLPALFLRETARYLESNPVAVSLFLGSDFPLSPANAFNGIQAKAFERLKSEDNAPQFFLDEGTQRQTAMFADLAMADPCVTCHNEHPDTPKDDWVFGDVMGATTWMHPEAEVGVDEVLASVRAFREGARGTYASYLSDAERFEDPPEVGDCWPSERRCLPTADVFMEAVEAEASSATMTLLLDAEAEGALDGP